MTFLLANWRWLAGAAAIAALILWLLHYGHERYASGVADTRADYARLAQEQIDFNQAHDKAEISRLLQAVNDYEAKLLVPVLPDLAHRVYVYALSACTVPQATTVTAGLSGPAAVPGSDPEFERLLGEAFKAGSKDAFQVIALQEAWPR